MLSIEQIAVDIVKREGGYVNDPDDPGGATKFGVTIHTMRRLGLDLTRDGRVDAADVRALTEKQAVDIFLRDYYWRPKINLLPSALQEPVFDMYVNAGGNAVKILQRVLNGLESLPIDLTVDGALGPVTARAAYQAAEAMGAVQLRDAYGAARREYYYQIGDFRPASRKYARTKTGGKGGWITRAEEFMSPAARFDTPQHLARIKGWAL